MATFSYKAIDKNSNEVKGTLEADDEKAVLSHLKDMGYFPVDIIEKEKAEELKREKREINDIKKICGWSIFWITVAVIFVLIVVHEPIADSRRASKPATPAYTRGYSVPGYTGRLEGKSFRNGTLIYTPDRYAIWFKNSGGEYFCINGGAKTLTGYIPYMPGDVNAYFKAAEQ